MGAYRWYFIFSLMLFSSLSWSSVLPSRPLSVNCPALHVPFQYDPFLTYPVNCGGTVCQALDIGKCSYKIIYNDCPDSFVSFGSSGTACTAEAVELISDNNSESSEEDTLTTKPQPVKPATPAPPAPPKYCNEFPLMCVSGKPVNPSHYKQFNDAIANGYNPCDKYSHCASTFDSNSGTFPNGDTAGEEGCWELESWGLTWYPSKFSHDCSSSVYRDENFMPNSSWDYFDTGGHIPESVAPAPAPAPAPSHEPSPAPVSESSFDRPVTLASPDMEPFKVGNGNSHDRVNYDYNLTSSQNIQKQKQNMLNHSRVLTFFERGQLESDYKTFENDYMRMAKYEGVIPKICPSVGSSAWDSCYNASIRYIMDFKRNYYQKFLERAVVDDPDYFTSIDYSQGRTKCMIDKKYCSHPAEPSPSFSPDLTPSQSIFEQFGSPTVSTGSHNSSASGSSSGSSVSWTSVDSVGSGASSGGGSSGGSAGGGSSGGGSGLVDGSGSSSGGGGAGGGSGAHIGGISSGGESGASSGASGDDDGGLSLPGLDIPSLSLAPLWNIWPSARDFKLSLPSAHCPVFDFNIFGNVYKLDAFCTVITPEMIAYIRLICVLAASVFSFIIVLRA